MTIFNHTTIKLSFGETLRTIFGKRIILATEIDTSADVEVTATRQTVLVEPLIKRKQPIQAASAPREFVYATEAEASAGLNICGYAGKWMKSKERCMDKYNSDAAYWAAVRLRFLELGGEYLA